MFTSNLNFKPDRI